MNILGSKVLYSCTAEDVKDVEKLREEGKHVNSIETGQLMPGMITADWSNGAPQGCCNVVVTLDGAVVPMWKTSIQEGTAPGTYMFAEF